MPAPAETKLFLVAAPGLEALVADEARRRLVDARVVPQPGGVELVGGRELIFGASLSLRLPTRILLRLGEIEARDFSKLRRGVAALPFAAFLPRGAAIAIRAAASRCRLYHTGAIAENVALALADAVGAQLGDGATAFSILVRGEKDRFTLSLDTSGARLHQRGWRREGGAAPLRETLAAALLALADHAADEPLVDPMCGSGTIAIEAAHLAIGRAPGLDRDFAFQRFVGHDEGVWQALRRAAREAERPRRLPIVAADADAAQLEVAARNAERAGVAELIELRHAPLSSLRPHAPAGLLLTNPPYGRRLGTRATLSPTYRALAAALRGPFLSWRAAILVEDRALLSGLGVDQARTRALDNGGVRVWVGQRTRR